MKTILFVLCLLFAQQTVVASVYKLRSKPTQHEKIRAILGESVVKGHYFLSGDTIHLLAEGSLIPPVLESGPLPGAISGSHSIEDWAQLLEVKAIASALTEVSASHSHMKEAKKIIVKQHGVKHGEDLFQRLLSLLLVKKGIEESGGFSQRQRVDRTVISNVMVVLATLKAVVPNQGDKQPSVLERSVLERDDVLATKDDLDKLKDEIIKEIKAHTTNQR